MKPTAFRNTELIYSDRIGEMVAQMGFKTILAEGAKHILGWKSPNYVYANALNQKLHILLRNYKFSDDIAFRFSNRSWAEWPLTAEKFAGWLADDGMAGFVVGHFLPLFSRHRTRRFGWAGNAPIDGFIDVFYVDRRLVFPNGQDRGFVEDVIDIGPGEAGGPFRQGPEIHIWIDHLVAGMDFEDGFPASPIGQGDRDGPIKAPGPAKSRIQDVVAVGSGYDEDAGIGFEAIHLDQQLVEGLLAFVVASA